MEELKKINKFFTGIDNIQQVYDEIQDSNKKEKLQLLKKSENFLILRLPLNLLNFKEILFTLKKKKSI